MGITRIQPPGSSSPFVTWLAFERRWTAKRHCGAWSRTEGAAQLRLKKNVLTQEQFMALEALDRVERAEGQERGGGDPHGSDLQVEQMRCAEGIGYCRRRAPVRERIATVSP